MEQTIHLLFDTWQYKLKLDYSNKPYDIVLDAMWMNIMMIGMNITMIGLDSKPLKEDCDKLKKNKTRRKLDFCFTTPGIWGVISDDDKFICEKKKKKRVDKKKK